MRVRLDFPEWADPPKFTARKAESNPQGSTHIYVLVRTGKQAKKKQQGISLLLAEIKTPGITLRPIRNNAGHDEFCQVFFDDVRVPRENLVGKLNEGWTVAKALLSFERLSIGSPRRPEYALRRLEVLARAKGLFPDRGFVDRYMELKLDIEDPGSVYGRFVEQVKRDAPLGQDVSMLKIWTMETGSGSPTCSWRPARRRV